MNEVKKLQWLKPVLLIKVILIFTVWAPAAIAPPALLQFFGLQMPSYPLFLRLFGALQASLGVAYWFAFKDPVRNRDIIKMGIIENGLVAVTLIILAVTAGVTSWFLQVSVLLTIIFCVLFIILKPEGK
ncbi:MAG: hypothetical protein KKH98_06180 [Spirochaetes bacterium]|nr:hypothetical protein [Spirochaetota bacterium]